MICEHLTVLLGNKAPAGMVELFLINLMTVYHFELVGSKQKAPAGMVGLCF